jgi:hypothetical protein
MSETSPFDAILNHMRGELKPNFLQVKLAIEIYALQHDISKEEVIKALIVVLRHLEELFKIESYMQHLKQ